MQQLSLRSDATGEATSSGPATIDVKDGGTGVRFNFPGIQLFSADRLGRVVRKLRPTRSTFVYQEDAPTGTASARYRMVKAKDWTRLAC
jgi:hypothetical protein